MNLRFARSIRTFVVIAVSVPVVRGEDAVPDARPIHQIIDHHIQVQLSAQNVEASARVGDAGFARRLTLDLAGRVPTTAELTVFLSSTSPDKRPQLVDRLLNAPDFDFHQRNELDLLLLARLRSDNDWREYLLQGVRENRPWDRLFREVLLPERERPGEKGAAAFLRERVKELDDLTNDTAVLFFGVNISCAKCHDHPLVPDWRQDHYFGLASFFKRTYRTKAGLLAERFDGSLKFTTVAGEEKPAQFMFLTGVSIDEPAVERSDDERKHLEQAVKKAEKEDQSEPPPLPDFSPRSELVRLALEESERHYFARNIANRVWARLMGRGLVHPLDQMHTENPPSHPELLDALARDFTAHGYDLKRLIRGIVLSDTYARSSRWTATGDPPPPELFARAVPRPLTPRQFSLSLLVVTANPEQLRGLEQPDEWADQRTELENRSNGLANDFEIPDANFQVSVEEALLFSNSERIDNELLGDSGDRLMGRLKTIEDTDALIDVAFLGVLSRKPDDDERAAMASYLTQRGDRRVAGLQQVVWVLLTSPEFRFNG